MLLDEARLQAVVSETVRGFEDCLQVVNIHDRNKERSVLNPYIVLTAVATWERYIVNLLGASEKTSWDIRTHDEFGSPAPWPGCRRDEREAPRHGGQHNIDHRLIAAGVLTAPLTKNWGAWISTDYRGSHPGRWRWGTFASSSISEERNVLTQGLLGAKSARDAVAHRIYHQKALEAESAADISKWHFTWSSDAYVKTGIPTIQNGYARGAVALLIQLVECTNHTIGQHLGFHLDKTGLPGEWFENRELWNFGRLWHPRNGPQGH